MKNTIVIFQTGFVTCLVIALFAVMGFAKPTPKPEDNPKQYIVVGALTYGKFETAVNEKLAEGWHLQGGVANVSGYNQAMTK